MYMANCITCLGALLLLGVFLPADACKCVIVNHPQWFCCRSNAVVKAKFLQPPQRGPTGTSHKTEIRYNIETLQVFHGDASLQNLTCIVSAMAGSDCEYKHPENGFNVEYVIAGSNTNGRVEVTTCSCIRRFSELTPSQIKGALGTYALGCGKCNITSCNSLPCEPVKGNCMLEEYAGGDSENQMANQACLQIEQDICAWETIQ